MKKCIATLFFFIFGFFGVVDAMADGYIKVSSTVRYELVGTYSINRLNLILTKELDQFTENKNTIAFKPSTNAVKLYRVIYKTAIPEKGNRPVEVSGLIAVPDLSKAIFPMVSYQHGTVFSRTEVPSFPEQSFETRLMIAHLAGNGYVVIAADYVGKGISSEPDSYMVKEATAQACADMLAASRQVLNSLNIKTDKLFLSGWSQGSWCTQVFRKRLEEMRVHITAAVMACTPNDLYLMLTRFINNPSPLDASWLVGIGALFINSYERYYDFQGLSTTAIKPEYWQTARDFYDNKISWSDAQKLFSPTIKELFQVDFANASSLISNRFYQQLFENQGYQWRYSTPTRFYYGGIDEAITPYVAILPVEYQKVIGGASSTAVYAGDNADHRGTFVFGVLDQKRWFDSLLLQK